MEHCLSEDADLHFWSDSEQVLEVMSRQRPQVRRSSFYTASGIVTPRLNGECTSISLRRERVLDMKILEDRNVIPRPHKKQMAFIEEAQIYWQTKIILR